MPVLTSLQAIDTSVSDRSLGRSKDLPSIMSFPEGKYWDKVHTPKKQSLKVSLYIPPRSPARGQPKHSCQVGCGAPDKASEHICSGTLNT
jgi:hypothetical protein